MQKAVAYKSFVYQPIMYRAMIRQTTRAYLAWVCISIIFTAFNATAAPLTASSTNASNELVIGQVASLSGTNGADLGLGLKLGIETYFKHINAQGGVNGRKLRLISKDDQYKPEETVRLTTELIASDAPLALIGYRGTANTLALIKSNVLVSSNTPLIGTLSGATEIQGATLIYHARTSYRDEITQLVYQLQRLSMTKVGVLYADDAFGKSGLDAVTVALASSKQQAVKVAVYDKAADKVEASIKQAAAMLAEARPQAVIMVAVGDPVYAFVKEMRRVGPTTQLYGISVVNPDAVVEKAGLEAARGIGFSQVFPYPYAEGVGLVREYRALLKAYSPNAHPAYFSLEGFVYAKLLVEAIRRAGPKVTRQKLIDSLDKLPAIDFGGFPIKMNSETHNGSQFTELAIIGKTGRLLR